MADADRLKLQNLQEHKLELERQLKQVLDDIADTTRAINERVKERRLDMFIRKVHDLQQTNSIADICVEVASYKNYTVKVGRRWALFRSKGWGPRDISRVDINDGNVYTTSGTRPFMCLMDPVEQWCDKSFSNY